MDTALQSVGRCPRCGYVLRFDGRRYTCDFCGFPRPQYSIMTMVRGVERNLSNKVKGFLDAFQKREVYVYYPIATKACVACGVNIAHNMLRCPHCGIIQPVNQASATAQRGEPELPSVDKRVFDYIVAHNGTISVSQAARELSLSQELLQESIDRLKSSGLLNPA